MTRHTSFSKETWQSFKSDQRPGKLHMLNFIRLRNRADYPDERSATGAQAYGEYSRMSAPVLKRLGGRIVWRGGFELTMVGPASQTWDICFIAEYPSVEAFADMMRDPVYHEAMAHRQAGVLDSRLVRFLGTADRRWLRRNGGRAGPHAGLSNFQIAAIAKGRLPDSRNTPASRRPTLSRFGQRPEQFREERNRGETIEPTLIGGIRSVGAALPSPPNPSRAT